MNALNRYSRYLEMESNFINIRDMIPKDNETDSAFGMRAWKNGQKNRKIRPDWEQVKVEAMFIVNCAKPSDGSIMIQFFHLRLWFRFVISYLICHQVQKCLNLFT